MPTLIAKVIKKVPQCPNCNEKYDPSTNRSVEYGAKDGEYWFKYQCGCSTKKNKVFVKYFANKDFIVINKKEDEGDAEE